MEPVNDLPVAWVVLTINSMGIKSYPNSIPLDRNLRLHVNGNKHCYTEGMDWSKARIWQPADPIGLTEIQVRDAYWDINIKKYHKLKRLTKLTDTYRNNSHKELHWPSVFRFMRSKYLDAQQKSIKWKVIRSAMITGKWEVERSGRKVESKCDLCHCSLEVHHAFADCSKVKEFWSRIHFIAKKNEK